VLQEDDDDADELPSENALPPDTFDANDEIFLRTSALPQAGQAISWAAPLLLSTSFSNGLPHWLHWYSNKGIAHSSTKKRMDFALLDAHALKT
jgi:hypothetical protein